METKPMKVWLDTDIGSDLDDALALAYLAHQPRCQLLGVSTVSGEAYKRAQMAGVLLDAAGQGHVPVYPGVEAPLLIPQKQPRAKQADALVHWPLRADLPQNQALFALQKAIYDNPGEVALVAIGPLTNVALLFAMDPNIPGMLHSLVMMCGVFTYGLKAYTCLSEWNARCDPHATAMVYGAPVKKLSSIGLDVTTQVTMTAPQLREHLATPALRPVLDFLNAREDPEGLITFHDPLAVATLFDQSICTFRQGNVWVELESRRLEGLTYFEDNTPGNDHVAFAVDSRRFFDHYFGVISRH